MINLINLCCQKEWIIVQQPGVQFPDDKSWNVIYSGVIVIANFVKDPLHIVCVCVCVWFSSRNDIITRRFILFSSYWSSLGNIDYVCCVHLTGNSFSRCFRSRTSSKLSLYQAHVFKCIKNFTLQMTIF